MTDSNNQRDKSWIRGVNLGGWLVLERYITPYQYAITDCHLVGDFCWYPGALSAPPEVHENSTRLCNLDLCSPYKMKTLNQVFDYPVDEWTLSEAFSQNRTIGEEWFNHHFDNFITKDDLRYVKNAGVTHIRVPIPHWILGNVMADEPWIPGSRWKAFKRVCQWARELDLEVWPNLHTAPGSQNGFDNSGVENTIFTCEGWSENAQNVQRTLDIIHEITMQMAQDGLTDVVTGFGLLNEPFGDCKDFPYQKFLDDGLTIARANLPKDTDIFVSDKFFAPVMNDGKWWLDPERYQHTYLDTHFYHMFDPELRKFGPKQHMDLVCHPDDKQLSIESCCYEDAPQNTTISKGVRRISTEWSVSYDCHPGELLSIVMEGISINGIAPDFHRELEPKRQDFLKAFGEAQMVAYEAKDFGLSDGWFFWSIKMEGGAFAEWDFTRGLKEGWLSVAPADTASEDVFGTCDQLASRTVNDTSIVHPFPWGDEKYWRDGVPYQPPQHLPPRTWDSSASKLPTANEKRLNWEPFRNLLALVGALSILYWLMGAIKHISNSSKNRKRSNYTKIDTNTSSEDSPLITKEIMEQHAP